MQSEHIFIGNMFGFLSMIFHRKRQKNKGNTAQGLCCVYIYQPRQKVLFEILIKQTKHTELKQKQV